MGDLANKMLVQHVSLGVGKVVALESKAVHVFFPSSDQRFAAKLRLPEARGLLTLEGVERNSWLEGLSDFSFDPQTNRYGLATTWLTHDQAVAQFLTVYPQGFTDPRLLGGAEGKGGRISRWRAAHQAWTETLGDGQGEKLLEAADLGELVQRVLRVERCVSPLQPKPERTILKEALADEESAQAFFRALLDILEGPVPGRARIDCLFGAAAHLPAAPAALWPVATLLPFIARPDRHVFLRAKPACDAAARLGCDLRFDDTPNWTTYAALRTLSAQLLERLQQHGARDFIDVEYFLHSIATKRPTARARSTQ